MTELPDSVLSFWRAGLRNHECRRGFSLKYQPVVFHALSQAPSEPVLDDEDMPEPLPRFRLDVLINPFLGPQCERTECAERADIAYENVRCRGLLL